jgi:hypothetical protein
MLFVSTGRDAEVFTASEFVRDLVLSCIGCVTVGGWLIGLLDIVLTILWRS